jgi:hypothetical protein
MALVQAKLKTASADDVARVASITDLGVLTTLVTALGRTRAAEWKPAGPRARAWPLTFDRGASISVML